MANAMATRKTLRVVIEIVLTWLVGPESHMSCIKKETNSDK
jgi:hypothetical protein